MADTKLNIIITATDKTKGAIKGIGKALGGIGKFAAGAAIAGIGAAVTGVGALAVGIGVLAKEAAKLGPITDAFDTINKSIGGNADDMLKSLSNASNGLITNTDLMTSFNKAAQLVNKDFATRLPDAMDYLGKVAGATGQDLDYLLDSLVTGVGRLSPMILDNLGIQVDLTAAQEAYALSIGKSASELTKAEQQTALMNQVMEKLATNTEGMTAISDPFKQMAVTFTNVKDTIASSVGPVILPLFQKLADGINKFVQSDEFKTWLETAVKWMDEKLVPAILDIIDYLGKELPPIIKAVAAWFKDTFIPAMKQVSEWITTKLVPALRDVATFIVEKVIPAIKDIAEWIKTEAVPWIKALWEKIKILVDGIKQWFSSDVPGALDKLRAAWAVVFERLQLVFDLFRAAFEGDWYAFGENLRKIHEKIWEDIKAIVSAAWEWIKDIDWGDLGKQIMFGIAKGVTLGMMALGEALVNAVKAAVDITKGYLGIHSPSALFRDEIGKMMASGMGEGFSVGVKQLAIGGQAQMMAPSRMMPAAVGPGGGASVIINYSPAISFADAYELEERLLPLIQRATRRQNG